MGDAKVTYGFVSFTEVDAGEHRSYNEWHLFDHMPEQFPLPGVVFGQRWVLTPELRESLHASAPLDRVHYVTLYLMREPIEETLRDFRQLAVDLRNQDRFHLGRTSHLAGPVKVEATAASPSAVVRPEALPYRPHLGVHVRIGSDGALPTEGVAGTWTFRGDGHAPDELRGVPVTWSWLTGAPGRLAPQLVDTAGSFGGTFATVDPFGAFDWFD